MKSLIAIPLFFSVILIFTILSYNSVAILTPEASASPNATIQEPDTSDSQSGSILTDVLTTPPSTPQANQSLVNATLTASTILESFERTVQNLITGIYGLIVVPLVISMLIPALFEFRRSRNKGQSSSQSQFSSREVFRLLVAIGVTLTVILIIVYLNTLVITLIAVGGPAVDTILEIEENFLTIIGTAFASLIAFYFGTRSTQASNAQRTTSTTGSGTGQKVLEVLDINPIDGTLGVEVDSPVTATFSTSIRSSTVNYPNTFSVKDANGNPVQGKITLTDNNTTITFNTVSPFNRDNRYTVTITKGILDISGASLVTDKEWHFTTVV